VKIRLYFFKKKKKKRSSHIEVDYHFIQEKVVNKDIYTRYISTHDRIADIFTKGRTTSRFLFLFLWDKLRVCSPPISLRGDVRTHDTAVPLSFTDATIKDVTDVTVKDSSSKQ